MSPDWYQQPDVFKPHGAGGQGSPNPPNPPGEFFIGINLTGPQNAAPVWPSAACVNYYATKLAGSNNNNIRFRTTLGWSQVQSFPPFATVGIQPTAFGSLDTGYLASLTTYLTAVAAAGAKAILDIHTFGIGPGGLFVGSAGLSISAFADLHSKLAAFLVANPSLLAAVDGIDLMNEWPNGFSSVTAIAAQNAAIAAIRLTGYTGKIYAEGVNYTSAWNWVSGTGNPFNSDLMYTIVDPLNNTIIEPHMYPDPDDSGTNYGYNNSVATAGAAPVGVNTGPTIGVTRMNREFLLWQQQHGLPAVLGEYGSSNDSPWVGGTFNYSGWNTITRNTIQFCQTNKYGFIIWAGGPGFPTGYNSSGYAYSLDPFSLTSPSTADFTATGVQHPVMTVLQEFTGYTGPQPTAYALFPPGIPSPNLYIPNGSPSSNFTVYYGGLVTTSGTITPTDFLSDGTTPAGGSFTPASISVTAGENFLATFTYTASQAATILIKTTNTFGWTDPPAIGVSSTTDDFETVSTSSIVALRRVVSTYIGPAITLINPQDGVTQQTFYFNNRGDLPRQAIQDFAASRSIPIARIYSQNGNTAGDYFPINTSGNLTPSLANPPTLTLVNGAGYPEVSVAAGQWMGTFAGSNGQGLLTLFARAAGSNVLISQDNFTEQFRLGSSGFSVFPNGGSGAGVSVGSFSTYQTIGGTFSNLYSTNNVKGFNNGSVVANASVAPFTFIPLNGDRDTFINGFRFGGQNFSGVWQEQCISFDEFSTTLMGTINTANNTYYSIPLPDPLTNVQPSITGTIANQAIYPGTITARPFSTVVIGDTNVSPTDSVTITLTGAAGTISGSGISGTGPYTISAASPASVTATLQAAVFTTANTLGHTTTFTIAVVSSAGTSNSNSNTSTIVTAYVPQPILTPPSGTFIGTNHSGWAFSGAELISGGFNSLWPQTFQIDYLASKGFGLMRFVITSKFLYTTAFGPLNTAYLAGMKQVIDYCFTKNIRVLIDPHDFGSVWNANANAKQAITPGTITQDLFQDFWRRLSNAFKNYPNVIFGLMNEPSAGGVSAAQWRDGGCTPAITAIWANGCTQLITIPGVGFSSALGWASNGNTAAFAGYAPSGAPVGALGFTFEAHQYLDSTAQGISPVYTINGSTVLNSFISFLTTNSFTGFIGEFGISWDPWYPISPGNQNFDSTMANPETTNNIVQNTNMLNAMISSGVIIGWAEWSAGNEFASPPTQNGYYFNPEPQRASSSAYVIPVFDQPGIATLIAKII